MLFPIAEIDEENSKPSEAGSARLNPKRTGRKVKPAEDPVESSKIELAEQ